MSSAKPPARCPQCGEDLSPKALACPECGSDAETGWNTEADTWSWGGDAGYGPEKDFDYEEFKSREYGKGRKAQMNRKNLLLVLVWVLVIALVLAFYFG